MRPLRLFSILAMMSFVACGGSDSGSLTGTNNTTGNMSATVAGSAWNAVGAAQYTNSLLSVAGIDLAGQTTISFAVFATGTGTYSVAFNNTGSNIALVSKANQTWASYAQGGSGSIVITTLTTHHAVGTFAFTGVASSGGGTLAVTNGKFDITF